MADIRAGTEVMGGLSELTGEDELEDDDDDDEDDDDDDDDDDEPVTSSTKHPLINRPPYLYDHLAWTDFAHVAATTEDP